MHWMVININEAGLHLQTASQRSHCVAGWWPTSTRLSLLRQLSMQSGTHPNKTHWVCCWMVTNINEAGLHLDSSPCRVGGVQTKPTDSVLLDGDQYQRGCLHLDSSQIRVGGVQTKPADSVLHTWMRQPPFCSANISRLKQKSNRTHGQFVGWSLTSMRPISGWFSPWHSRAR